MHIHLRIQHWVIWWFYVGVVCGAVALSIIILGHNLTGTQDRIILAVGVAHWLLGGIVCWAFEGVKVEPARSSPPPKIHKPVETALDAEWHPASDFLQPGMSHRLLPWRH
jgi:hypothetical protein